MEFGSVSDVISSQAHHLNCNNTAVEFHTASMLEKLHFLNPALGDCSPFAPSHSNSDNTAAATRVTKNNDTDQNKKESHYYHLEAGATEKHDENTTAYAHTIDASIVTEGDDKVDVAKKTHQDQTLDKVICLILD